MSETKPAAQPAKSKPAAKKPAAVKDSISVKELAHAVAVAAEVYRSNAMGVGVESHSAMTFDGKYLRASTLAAAIKVPLETKFKATVNGQTLAKIVDALESHGSETVAISVKDSVMSISSGRSNVETVVLQTEAGELANMNGAAKLKVDSDTRAKIVLAMSQALRAAGTKDVRYYLNGIHFLVEDGDLAIAASEGFLACRANTGIKGAEKFNKLSLTRDTTESIIAIADKVDGGEDTLLYKSGKDGAAFGWQFANGVEICSSVLDVHDGFDLTEAMGRLLEMNTDKLKAVPAPDGLIDALNAGKIAASSNRDPVYFNVKDGVMSVKTGDINTGIVYKTTDIATEIKDTEVAYDFALLTRVVRNPADLILFYNDGPLFIGNVEMEDMGEGVRTFLMPMRV